MKNKLYFFDIKQVNFLNSEKCRYNASSKPRYDSEQTLKDLGAIEILLISKYIESSYYWLKKLKMLANSMSVIMSFLHKWNYIRNNLIIVQYPFGSNAAATYILKRLKAKHNKIILYVHDIASLRYKKISKKELELFRLSDAYILHSNNMIEKMKDIGFNKLSVSLEFFDYRSNLYVSPPNDLRNIKMIYAGNLQKSIFLNSISQIEFNLNYQLYLYGVSSKNIILSEFVQYKGKFDAEQFDGIEGNWGLVWDGESIDTCKGCLGEYLKYNAPFKMSLYLAAGRPVIVWSQSAMAEYVRKYNIGICVDSLHDVPKVINALSDNELELMANSVNQISLQVKSGEKLKTAVQKICEFF